MRFATKWRVSDNHGHPRYTAIFLILSMVEGAYKHTHTHTHTHTLQCLLTCVLAGAGWGLPERLGEGLLIENGGTDGFSWSASVSVGSDSLAELLPVKSWKMKNE